MSKASVLRCWAVVAGLGFTSAVWAQPVEVRVEDHSDPVNSPPGTRTCNLVVHFDQAGDVLVVQSIDISTNDPVGFFQVSSVFGTTDLAPPQLWIDIVPDYAFDSFVDIGVKVRPTSGYQTTLTQDWDSLTFNCGAPPTQCAAVIGGWYNATPDNGLGHAEAGADVFIAQFTVGSNYTVSGSGVVYVRGPFAPPLTECPDLNGDGVVNAQDLFLLLSQWGPCADCLDCAADLNGDCVVDVDDLVILLSGWMLSCDQIDDGPLPVPFEFQCFEAECLEDLDCDDGNPCIDSVCIDGGCVHTPNSDPCEDGDACTAGDVCVDGNCVPGVLIDCDDGNACTDDDCDLLTGCVHVPLDCDDGDACTNDACDPATGCTHDLLDCDDGNSCTVDGCDSAVGCTSMPLDCDDQDACTVDGCDPGTGCTYNDVDCDDDIECTMDSCDLLDGCLNEPVNAVCDDDNLCTLDQCIVGQGCEYTAVICSDDDTCTDDVCSPTQGCLYPPCAACRADLNGDGTVDAADLAMLLGAWGDCIE